MKTFLISIFLVLAIPISGFAGANGHLSLFGTKKFIARTFSSGASTTAPAHSITGAAGQLWNVQCNVIAQVPATSAYSFFVFSNSTYTATSNNIWNEPGAARPHLATANFQIIGAEQHDINSTTSLSAITNVNCVIDKFKM